MPSFEHNSKEVDKMPTQAPSQQPPKPPARYPHYSNSRESESSQPLDIRSTVTPRPSSKRPRLQENSNQENESESEDDGSQNVTTTPEDSPKSTADFIGTVILFDKEGWRQKVYLSYSLEIEPSATLTANSGSGRLLTDMKIHQPKVKVTQSTFKEETRPPQLQICRTKLVLQPSIDGFDEGSVPEGYREDWLAPEHAPSKASLERSFTVGTETAFGGKVQIGLQPNVQLEYTRKRKRDEEFPPLAQIIDLEKSQIDETPYGGLFWDYRVQVNSGQGVVGNIELGTHSGRSSIPRSNYPSSFEASIDSWFELVNNQVGGPNFPGRKVVGGLAIAYHQIKIALNVEVNWCSQHLARIPRDRSSAIYDSKLSHCFQVRENSCPKQRLIREMMTTELTAQGDKDEGRNLMQRIQGT